MCCTSGTMQYKPTWIRGKTVATQTYYTPCNDTFQNNKVRMEQEVPNTVNQSTHSKDEIKFVFIPFSMT